MTNTNPETIIELNKAFSANTKAIELKSLIAKCASPMVFDLNGVLASDAEPITLNPKATESLRYVLEHGITPFIITLADNWQYIFNLLQSENHNVLQEVVIMTNRTWATDHPYPPWNKQVRHLFPGSNPIPIIENDIAAVRNNRGMKGYFVKTYRPLSELLDSAIHYDYPSLMAATMAATEEYIR
jgi:hypothetical protein